MEDKKNNAVEKVENIIKNKKHPKSIRVRKKSQEMSEKEQKERQMAEKRVEMARIKAQQKAEKQKAKAVKLREKMRRKEQNGENKKSNGYGGWLAAVITLSVATLVLASVLTFTFLMPTATDAMLENTYKKSFYDTVEQVDNIDLNLSKILASKDQTAVQKYLVDTAINSELAENDLQQLPLHDESKFYTTKLINQIGDFSKYLNNKIADGGSISKQDREMLLTLYQHNKTLKESLSEMVKGMGEDYSFKTVLGGGSGNLVIKGFNNLENLSVEYPELIYDGPFSDGQESREIKGLTGEEIDQMRAKEIFKGLFADYSLEDVMNDGMTTGDIECYNVSGYKDGEQLYAQISKKGGKLITFAYAGSCNAVNVTEETAVEKASEFLEGLGIKGVKEVWINLTGNVYTINFAYEQNDVIVYSDLIKVRVCAETGMVIGIEAKSYYTNHTARTIGAPALSQSQASKKVWDDIGIITCRLALVPIGTSSEKLCYEFSGEYEDQTYYVYIDAVTGKQVEMFKVISSTEGELLM